MSEANRGPRNQPPSLSAREIIEGLEDPMGRRGFVRRNPSLAEADPSDQWVASWLRMPPDDQFRDAIHADGSETTLGFYDGVSVWSAGYVNVGMQGNRFVSRVEWRTSPLDPDEFACVVAGIVDQFDRFVPHTGPALHQGGWTRG